MFNVRKLSAVLLSVVLLAALGATASAQSLKSQRKQQAEQAQLEGEAAYSSNVCGSDISAQINWRRSATWPADQSLADICDGALSALEGACRSGNKTAQSVNNFVCSGDGSGASLRGSSLYYGASPGDDAYGETKDLFDSRG